METNKNLKEQVLQKIRTHEVLMRPKVYFTFKMLALALVSFLVLVTSIFIFNFLLFTLRINGHETFLSFGPRGVGEFLRFFPWELLLVDIALVVGLQWMLRTFRFGYKIPAVYLLGGLLVLSALLGAVMDRGTPFNDHFLDEADHHRLPGFVDDFYDRARRPLPPGEGVCKCTVVAIDGSVLTVKDTWGTTTLNIQLPPNDPRATTTNLQVGDIIFVAGDLDDGIIRAYGVRELPSVPPMK